MDTMYTICKVCGEGFEREIGCDAVCGDCALEANQIISNENKD